jgi:hypothetical protein
MSYRTRQSDDDGLYIWDQRICCTAEEQKRWEVVKNSVSICRTESDNQMTMGCIFVISEFAAQQRSRRGGRCCSFHILDCHSFTLSSCPELEASAPGSRARPRRGFLPTNSTLTDILWCNSDSLYKGERRRKAEALVVQWKQEAECSEI